ncbi:SRPBCC family protein [Streptomyces sp. NPDC005133]
MSASTSDHDPIGGLDPSAFAFSRRAWVDATPAGVYDLVSDVSAIARWSPDATEVTYDEGAGPQVGAWFSGRNQRDGRQWSSRSQVVRAEPGSSFAFVVGGAEGGIVRWTWALHPCGRGTVVEHGSIPSTGMAVRSRLSVLCPPVVLLAGARARARPPAMASSLSSCASTSGPSGAGRPSGRGSMLQKAS